MLNREELTLILVSAGGNIARYNAISANSCALANSDWTENSCARSNHNGILDGGVALSMHNAGRTKSYIVIDHHIIAHDCGLANHNSHAVIDKESSSDLCGGMDLDTGHSSNPVRIKSRQEF
jgi:hypothetical protein